MRVAGIMSGTSLDGVDVAVIDIERGKWNLAGWKSTPYAAALRRDIMAVSNCDTHTSAISRLNFRLGEVYAKAVKTCGVPVETIELIGCHGQTIFHEGSNTLQIGEAAVLAERTGIPVVNDFRPRDIAAGGKGAPLVPFVDYLLFQHKKLCRVVLNIGGIANITLLPPDCEASQVIAFDTGPGNMVIDALVQEATRGKQSFDRGGRLAAKGKAHPGTIDSFMRDSYYRAAPPKTAGREQYGREFVDRLKNTGLEMHDLIATATALTAATIAAGIHRFATQPVDELIVSGGGAHNPILMGYLAALISGTKLRGSDEFGVPGDAKEAIAFAMLAHRTWHRKSGNLPSATGAAHDVVLGKITF